MTTANKKTTSNVVGLAKGKTTTSSKKPTTTKKTTPKEMAKQKVSELLSDSAPDIEEVKDSFELVENNKHLDWLEEQVQKLTEENERLRNEKEGLQLKLNKTGTVDSNKGALNLFNEFQTEYLKHRPETRGYTQIYLTALMNKMIVQFPFLKSHKKF